MRYHIYNDRDAVKPLLSLHAQMLVYWFSGLVYKRWGYFLAVDSKASSPIYEWTKNRNTDGTINMSGPRMVRDAALIERSEHKPTPMRNYRSKLASLRKGVMKKLPLILEAIAVTGGEPSHHRFTLVQAIKLFSDLHHNKSLSDECSTYMAEIQKSNERGLEIVR